jgi:hypothetical protein
MASLGPGDTDFRKTRSWRVLADFGGFWWILADFGGFWRIFRKLVLFEIFLKLMI